MAIELSTNLAPKNEEGFFLAEGKHLKDVIIIVADNTTRDALPPPVKVEGVIVFSVASDAFYQYLSNAWVLKPLGSGGTVTASNGLTKDVSGNITLEGALTKTTTVDGNNQALFFSNNSFFSIAPAPGQGFTLTPTALVWIGPWGSISATSGNWNQTLTTPYELNAPSMLFAITGSGNGAKYLTTPTILTNTTIPSWKNVTDAILALPYDLDFTASANAPLSLALSIYGEATIVGTENKAGQVTGVSYYGSTDGGDTFVLIGDHTALITWVGLNSGVGTFIYLKAGMITTSTQLQVVNITYTKS